MADISVTATSVTHSGTGRKEATAGATITAGQTIYLDSTDSNKAKLCDNDSSEATATCVGIALNNASSGQPVDYASAGNVTFNAVLTKGTIYCTSSTAGGIAPAADLASSDYVTILGVASSTTVLKMNLYNSGVTV